MVSIFSIFSTGSAGARSEIRCAKSCHSCGDWGAKDVNTVKISLEHLPALLGTKTPSAKTGKENDHCCCEDLQTLYNAPSSAISQSKTENTDTNTDKCLQSENTDKENVVPSSTGISTAKEVKFEEAINKASQKLTQRQELATTARQAERALMEKQQNEIMQRVRDELQRVKDEQDRQEESKRRAIELDRQRKAEQMEDQREALRLQQEHQHRLDEEALRQREEEDEKREQVRSWLRKNGFKDPNQLKRKVLHKVRPLHIAVKESNVALVKLLLSAGGDVTLTDGNDETVVEVAKRVDKKDNSIRSEAVLKVILSAAGQ